jgi:hypothetical protein
MLPNAADRRPSAFNAVEKPRHVRAVKRCGRKAVKMTRNVVNFVIDSITALVMAAMVVTGLVIRYVLSAGTGRGRSLWGMAGMIGETFISGSCC